MAVFNKKTLDMRSNDPISNLICRLNRIHEQCLSTEIKIEKNE